MTDTNFFDSWSSLRASVSAVSDESEADEFFTLTARARELSEIAHNAREQALAAAVQISVGALASDVELINGAESTLAATATDHLREALEAIGDLSSLGLNEHRWFILQRAFGQSADPALDYIEHGDPRTALTLAQVEWTPDASLQSELRRELRLQVSWQALQQTLNTGNPEHRRLFAISSLSFSSGAEPGWWERALHEAIMSLIEVKAVDACGKVELLLRRSPPRWTSRRMSLEIARFASLAGHSAVDWLALAPAGIPDRRDAPSPEHAALISLARLHAEPSTSKPAKISAHIDVLRDCSWALFASFVNPTLRHAVAEYLAQELMRLPSENFKTWPWDGRVDDFAESVRRLEQPQLAIDLLVRAIDVRTEPSLKRTLADVMSAAPAEVVKGLPLDQLASRLGDEHMALSKALRAALGRGGTTRAVIDGSNVMWGGLSRKAGARPSFALLKEAIRQLNEAGFVSVEAFIDAATRHDLTSNDWNEVERLKIRKTIVVVPGVADPAIIKSFLKDPRRSEIITCDNYNDWQADTEFAEFLQWWPQRKRVFYVDHDGDLQWSTSLDRKRN